MADEITYNINLIIEDGSGVPSANSYISLAYADQYAVNRNYTSWIGLTDYEKNAAIIKAMDYVDSIFDWKGTKMHKYQPLNFPRRNIIDNDGFDYTGEIPEQLKRAICEAAFYVQDQYTLYTTHSADGALKVDRKKADVAEIEKQYFSNKEVVIDWTSTFQSLDTMLKGLFYQKGERNRIDRRVHWMG